MSMSEEEKIKCVKEEMRKLKMNIHYVETILGVHESPKDEAARAITFVQGILEVQKRRVGHKFV